MADSANTPREASAEPAHPDYPIAFEPSPKRVHVVFNGVTVADSPRAMIMREARLPPVYYFPRQDVRMDLMHRTRHRTHCPFRGNATYWTLKVGERVAENAAWSYEDPYEPSREIKDYLAFHQEYMDSVYEEDQAVTSSERALPVHTNPLLDWLLRKACDAPSVRELVSGFAQAMADAGIPVWRLWLTIRTLHPQLLSNAYLWQRDASEVEENPVGYEVLHERRYLESPVKLIFDGFGGVRRQLDVPDPQLDYPIVRDLYKEGATDYVAMPLVFSDGQVNAISLSTWQPGGFSTEQLGYIYEVLPLVARLIEVHATRRVALNLLNTYLGTHSGERVLSGLVRRGDGETVYSVIWFCDLRESTALAESMSRQEFLSVLNAYFECMAGPVLDHGGEVLRFIGDAVLAIFPVVEVSDDTDGVHISVGEACRTAAATARDAVHRMSALNDARTRRGEPRLHFGLGLHVGEVMYGNIGTPSRLEFSVIGAAANQAARIESLCKTLGVPVALSSEFARHYGGELVSLGRHRLRGVNALQEIYTLPPEELRTSAPVV
ncbi:MAG: DUF427 domain-containing protein [Gammaproteobacteria bacterium]|nr:DUF427 domain-containing protein [Gammaproteobacteria bacterium]NIR85767.1 DUF427 domain-containing protein [Gammaproteobacteria bacterium]NIR90300.1 DUF427 domain-containing protein [Gammaproteobacteria bacterium]NIU06901.1 DUF427 domain-containing protein [Gammaproteobacteria bacterium]NIV53834.1 DUF427 domain-containing protein [Gammaproteobacteria bacterium]